MHTITETPKGVNREQGKWANIRTKGAGSLTPPLGVSLSGKGSVNGPDYELHIVCQSMCDLSDTIPLESSEKK